MTKTMRESISKITNIKQQYVYIVRFHPSLSGLKKYRPALVVQTNYLNAKLDSFVVLPLSTKPTPQLSTFEVPIFEPFLKSPSVLLPFMITTIDRKYFEKELGKVHPNTFRQAILTIERACDIRG